MSATILLVFAYCGGAFDSDLGGDPDEAAHAVTALMVRDYLMDGLGQPPMAFAKSYYEAFPRVALGHYPPMYYVFAAPWLLLSPSIKTLILLQVILLAALALLTFQLGRRMVPDALALASGIGVLLLPLALKLSLHVMADILLAVMCLWAVILWADYMRSPSPKRALAWGAVAAAAILTKGSGIGLCLLPPVATLLAGRWRLMLGRTWWCAALPVAMLAGPWMVYSTKISKEGMTQLSPWQYLTEATPFYFKSMPEVFGWPLVILTCVATVTMMAAAWKHSGMREEHASLIAMAAGITAVLLLVPVGVTTRYMLTLTPCVLLASACALNMTAVAKKRCFVACSSGGLLLCAFLPLADGGSAPSKRVYGFGEAVLKSCIPSSQDSPRQWLVASDPRGEGAMIAAAAFACPQRSPSLLRVYRGSKELAQSDWMGRGYQAAFVDAKSLLNHLDARGITRVFLDLSVPENARKEHEVLLEKALRSPPSNWILDFEQQVTRAPRQTGKLHVYKRI